jgi:hypothetical protein
MEAAIDRIMQTYDLLVNRTAAASAEARAKVTDYVTTLFEAGEKDTHRLTVCGFDLSARTRRLQRSREGRVYGVVRKSDSNNGIGACREDRHTRDKPGRARP